MERHDLDRVARLDRRLSGGDAPLAERQRSLLVGPDEAWRLLTAYVFERAESTAYAALQSVGVGRMGPAIVCHERAQRA